MTVVTLRKKVNRFGNPLNIWTFVFRICFEFRASDL